MSTSANDSHLVIVFSFKSISPCSVDERRLRQLAFRKSKIRLGGFNHLIEHLSFTVAPTFVDVNMGDFPPPFHLSKLFAIVHSIGKSKS
jgi:hypothetical protein